MTVIVPPVMSVGIYDTSPPRPPVLLGMREDIQTPLELVTYNMTLQTGHKKPCGLPQPVKDHKHIRQGTLHPSHIPGTSRCSHVPGERGQSSEHHMRLP